MSDVLPLRDAFLSIFFVSLGMLFDVRVVMAQPLWVGVLLASFVLGKAAIAGFVSMLLGFPARIAWLTGIGLAQFGELGFVLARLGETHGVATIESMRPVLTAGILSMFLAPVLVRWAPHFTLAERWLAPFERLPTVPRAGEATPERVALTGHVVLVGYGVAGKLVARALAACGVPFVVLELNAKTVRVAKQAGEPVHYADATSPVALENASFASARALVLLINDPRAAERVVDAARRTAPAVPVLMRSRYLADREKLLSMAAKGVVVEEVEGAAALSAELLSWLGVDRGVAAACIDDVRAAATS